jgi:putative transposase
MDKIRTKRHCFFALHAHLVLVTKKRGKVFNSKHLKILYQIFQDVCIDFPVELKEFNGEWARVHLLIFYPPEIALSSFVNSLKEVSCRLKAMS